MIDSAVAGLLTGLSLIVAIGAQNAFVLRQGLRRELVGPVVAICAVSDMVLIAAGVVGIGTLVERAPWALSTLRWFGVTFLTWYGVRSLLKARAPDTLRVSPSDSQPRKAVLFQAVALTWLNPHVYLDTVLLLGSIANHEGEVGRWWFAAGASLGSIAWFAGLGYGARLLSPLLAGPRAWQVLDVLIGLVMLTLAVALAGNR